MRKYLNTRINLKTTEKYCRAAVVRQEKVIYCKNKMKKKTFGLTSKTSGEVNKRLQ
jgi:hypothetical protein